MNKNLIISEMCAACLVIPPWGVMFGSPGLAVQIVGLVLQVIFGYFFYREEINA